MNLLLRCLALMSDAVAAVLLRATISSAEGNAEPTASDMRCVEPAAPLRPSRRIRASTSARVGGSGANCGGPRAGAVCGPYFSYLCPHSLLFLPVRTLLNRSN